MSGLQGVIARRNTGTYTVTRETDGADVDGRWVPGSTTTLSVDASVQPVTGDAMEDLPQGIRVEDVRILWTVTELRTEKSGTGADLIAIGDLSYRVFKVEYFGILSSFYRVTVHKVNVP